MVVLVSVDGVDGLVFVVTGGAGYVGRKLCLELIQRGASKVRCFDKNISPARHLAEKHASIELIQGDITNLSSVHSAISGAHCVFHNASFGMSGKQMLQKAAIRTVNLEGTRNLVDACLTAGVPRLVYTSTYNVVFGGQEIDGGDEEMEYWPLDQHVDEYGRTKAMAEKMVLKSNHLLCQDGVTRLQTAVIRPAAIYGPGEERHFPRIMTAVRSGLLLFCIGTKSSRVDWAHVDNVVHALILVAASLALKEVEKPHTSTSERKTRHEGSIAAGQAYFISDGVPINNFEFLRPIIATQGVSLPSYWLPLKPALFLARIIESFYCGLGPLLESPYLPQPFILPAEVYKVGVNHHFKIKKAALELGYVPIIGREEGLRQMCDYWRAEKLDSFDRPGLVPTILIPTGLFLLTLSAFTSPPSMGAFEVVRELGIVLFSSIEGLQIVWQIALAIHVFESIVAFGIALQKDPKNRYRWFWQTMVFGFWSLRLLLQKSSPRLHEA